jgi:riboflavin kinase/FMN adenylyltransferase
MEIITDLQSIPASARNAWIALGNFDGVHMAHQEIIRTCISKAKDAGVPAMVVTFSPHPVKVLAPHKHHVSIISETQRREIIKGLGIDYLLEIPFNQEFAATSAQDFITTILEDQLNVQGVVTGYNFYFGHKRQGDSKMLSKHALRKGWQYISVKQISVEHFDVSSSEIKRMLAIGGVGIAAKMLGHFYFLDGQVVKGRQQGSKMGFPTANLKISDDVVMPMFGVYLVETNYGPGVANFGVRPTITQKDEINPMLEVHLFDFAQNIYNKDMRVKFLQLIRPERTFPDIDALKYQIANDCNQAKYAWENRQHFLDW